MHSKKKNQYQQDNNSQSRYKYPVNDLSFIPHANWTIFKRSLTYLKPFWFILLLGALATAAASLLDAYLISMLRPVLDRGLGKSLNSEYLQLVALGLLVVVITRATCLFISGYLISYVSGKVINILRGLVFRKFLHMPRDFFDESGIGVLQNRLNGDITLMTRLSGATMITLVRDSSYSIALIAVMIYNSWKLSLVIFIVMPIIFIIVIYISHRFKKITASIMRNNSILLQKSIEMLRNHNIVQSFGGHKYEEERFQQVNNQNRQINMKMMVVSQIGSSLIVILASLSLSVMIYLTSFPMLFGSANNISPGQFTVVFAAMLSLSKPLRSLTTINADIQVALTAADKVFSTLDLAEEENHGIIEVERAKGKFNLQDVVFRYHNIDKDNNNIINHVNLEIPAGKVTALVGKSGSGKTTLVNLLSRVYEINHGQITLDDIPLHDYNLQNLRRQISIVSQNTELFNDTIYNNIVYCDAAHYTHQQVMDVVHRSYVWEFVKDLPQGLDSLIGDSGLRLSGGQRQRLSIARALLRNAPIIILDEATSALDTESEKFIQKSIQELQDGRTVIIIAHRLSTIENADNIVVMDNGTIVEQGTHTDLLTLGKAYANLYKMQFNLQAKD